MSKKTPIVIDNGEDSIKAGLAGDEAMKSAVPSLVGRQRLPWAQRADIKVEDIVAGTKASALDSTKYDVRSPICRGMVNNWDDLELLWQQCYEQSAIKSEERPVLMGEVPLNSIDNRATTAEILFEKFGTSSLLFVPSAVMSLYSVGMTKGIVLDCGEGMTHAVPVFEGMLLQEGIFSSQLGGRDVTAHLQQQFRRAGFEFASSSAREVLRNYKESECYCASRSRADEEGDYDRKEGASKAKLFKLPDGTGMIPVGMERFRAPDVLFAPQTLGMECAPVHQLVSQAIQSVDLTLRKELFTMLTLAGGTSMMKGFGDRFLYELRRVVPKDVKIKVTTPPNRQQSAWVGGSIVASLPLFDKLAVTKAQFEEAGAMAFTDRVADYFTERGQKADSERYPPVGKGKSSK